jgi:hypothetical protein
MTTSALERPAYVPDDVELTDEELAQLVDPDTVVRPVDYVYEAHPKQAIAHGSFADELLYGGAAGGGKSRFARAEAVAECLEVPGLAGIIFRRTFPDLARAGGVIPKLLEEVPRELGSYNAGDHRWTFHNGSTLELAHLGRDADVTKYQGAEYQLIVWEEATHFTAYQYDYLKSRLRASGRVAEELARLGRRPRVILTANPGGVGHAWVKARFIDPVPAGRKWRPAPTDDEPSPGTRLFIPAKVADNPSVDEGYVRRLDNLEDDLRRALRDGDWNVYQGQRFRAWRTAVHVIEPEELPLGLGGITRAVGVDYGLDAPFAALWGAKLADGLVVVYRELYKAGLTAGEQADAIAAAERPGERSAARRVPVALDPSTWARNPHVRSDPKPAGSTRVGKAGDGAEAPPTGSIADAYRQRFGADLVKAYNGRLDGVALVADKLRVRADGLPRLLVYSTCRNLIRTLPSLPRDQRRPEDVDTSAEDHAYDALRYLLAELERAPAGGSSTARATYDGSRRASAGDTVTAGLTRQGF